MTKCCLDIETCALPEAADYLEDPEPPANYKDEDKIAAWIEVKKAEQLSKCALDLDLAQIVALAFQTEGHEIQCGTLSEHAGDEAELISWFWTETEGCHYVTFNGVSFDLAMLQRRSLYLGIPAPRLELGKYRHNGVTDLMLDLSYSGAFRYRGLTFYAKRFGLEIPEDEITGAEIGRCVAEGDWSAIRKHVTADVRLTASLAERLGAFDGSGLKEFTQQGGRLLPSSHW